MPSAQNIIVTNNTVSSCTPMNFELWCGTTGGVLQHHLSFGQDPVIFKRNNVDQIDCITLSIDQPAYLGCNKLELCNSEYFPSGTGSVPNNAEFKLTDMRPDGKTGNFVVFGNPEVSCPSKFSYQMLWEGDEFPLVLSGATGGDGYTGFIGCNMALEVVEKGSNGQTAASRADAEISNSSTGFPLCDGLSEQCSVLCGKLTMCGTRNEVKEMN